jgi:antitoxin (DNA-binding transcriptional repressor) of toxin-antitoxin stability system
MATTASIRDLRNQFPKVKKLLEDEGEVVVTEHGTPRYRLTRYMRDEGRAAPAAKDYLQRLRRHQPRPLSAAASKRLDERNRGQR